MKATCSEMAPLSFAMAPRRSGPGFCPCIPSLFLFRASSPEDLWEHKVSFLLALQRLRRFTCSLRGSGVGAYSGCFLAVAREGGREPHSSLRKIGIFAGKSKAAH